MDAVRAIKSAGGHPGRGGGVAGGADGGECTGTGPVRVGEAPAFLDRHCAHHCLLQRSSARVERHANPPPA